MDCESFSQLLGSWMDGKLDAASRASMAEHVQSCADCRVLHEERQALRDLVRSSKADELVPKLIASIRESVFPPAQFPNGAGWPDLPQPPRRNNAPNDEPVARFGGSGRSEGTRLNSSHSELSRMPSSA